MSERKKLGSMRYPKESNWPQLGWWAPGAYLCQCVDCSDYYTGDKRSRRCADCEYQNAQPTEQKGEK